MYFCVIVLQTEDVVSNVVEMSASEMSVDSVLSTVDVEYNKEGEKLSATSDCTHMAVSLSSESSSYSVITLKDSPDEIVMHGSLSSHPESVSVSVAGELDSAEKQRQLNCTGYQPGNRSDSSTHDLHIVTSPAVADNLLSNHCDTAVTCNIDVALFVDRVERKMTLGNKERLNITELAASLYHYCPSFPSLPAIVESCRSDDAQLSDTSAASGDGYDADGGILRSESFPSNASSPTGSLGSVAMSVECSDRRQPVTHITDGASSVTSASVYGGHPLQLDAVPFTVSALSTTATSDGQQLSAKSSSDGIDSAVVCTPYSTQTSQDSSSIVDNTISSYCRSISDVTDDHTVQPLPSAADEMHPVSLEDDKVMHATVNWIANEDADAGRESVGEDSDDEMSMASMKIDWEIGSDSETARPSDANIAPLIKSSTSVVRQPFLNTVGSFQSLMEQSQEFERQRIVEPAARPSCCACMSCVIMRHCVSTAADVTPTISVRMCSSVVDVVCLIQRLVMVCSTWIRVLCSSPFHLERLRHSRDDKHRQDTALMRPTSAQVVCDDFADDSAHVNLRSYTISEGLESIREGVLQQLIDVRTMC